MPETSKQMLREWLAIHEESLVHEEHEQEVKAEATEIVDVAKLEAVKRERELARMRAYTLRRYYETKQAALIGDEDAQERWRRMQATNRAAQRRWRATHPEQHVANQREYKRRKKLKREQSPNPRTESANAGE